MLFDSLRVSVCVSCFVVCAGFAMLDVARLACISLRPRHVKPVYRCYIRARNTVRARIARPNFALSFPNTALHVQTALQLAQNLSGIMLIYSKGAYDPHVRVHNVLNTQVCLKLGFWGMSRPRIVDYKVLTRPTRLK